ncbi:SRPBCC family protein [Streptomyces sp. NPDC004609]|uniref:SRPBCC family protein n=1 Tax=Streptomyces sp. NPDC004609 TaxID=3364704 RepID=UPI00368C32CA
MDWYRYRFHTVWDLTARPDAVYEVLADAEDYPSWWPQVRSVIAHGEDSGAVRFRSFLPYELRVTAHAVRRDPEARVLEIGMEGDLEGWARWTVGARGFGTRAVYDQEVEVRRPLMRRLALPCRPVFRANHAAMMRAGLRGIDARLRDGKERKEI